MILEHIGRLQEDPRIQRAIEDLKRIISEHFPEATYEVGPGDCPAGIYLVPTVDVDDTDEVIDPILNRLTEIQDDEGLPVYVMPRVPRARLAAQLEEQERLHPEWFRQQMPVSPNE